MQRSWPPLRWRAPGTPAGRPALLVDRDGVINRKIDGGYVLSWAHFTPIDDFITGVRPIAAAGFPIVIVTNQSCVGRGLIGREDMHRLMLQVADYLERLGVPIAGYVCCPHAPREQCRCRKPRPGLLLEAQRLLGISLEQSVFVGDRQTDYEAGLRAGVRTLLVREQTPQDFHETFQTARRMLMNGRCHAVA
jgi:histidinol-phosphate phosphatase family protein